MITDFNHKKIAILGVGVEGLSTIKYLVTNGITPVALDERMPDKALLEELQNLGVTFVQGFKDLEAYEVLFRSPGISITRPELQEAHKKGVKITSQTKFFLQKCPSPVIGVTGTKGKGTTASLIYQMLKEEGKDVYLGGNIGEPPLGFLNKLTPQSQVVLELSSFQLQDIDKSPYIAVMLMIVPEHLNYHADMGEYVNAKRNLLRFQSKDDYAVINRDYIASNESDISTEGQVFYVTRERTTTEQGVFVRDNAIWMTMRGRSGRSLILTRFCSEAHITGKMPQQQPWPQRLLEPPKMPL